MTRIAISVLNNHPPTGKPHEEYHRARAGQEYAEP